MNSLVIEIKLIDKRKQVYFHYIRLGKRKQKRVNCLFISNYTNTNTNCDRLKSTRK